MSANTLSFFRNLWLTHLEQEVVPWCCTVAHLYTGKSLMQKSTVQDNDCRKAHKKKVAHPSQALIPTPTSPSSATGKCGRHLGHQRQPTNGMPVQNWCMCDDVHVEWMEHTNICIRSLCACVCVKPFDNFNECCTQNEKVRNLGIGKKKMPFHLLWGNNGAAVCGTCGITH